MRKLIFLFPLFIYSCAVVSDYRAKEFTYQHLQLPEKLSLHVPKGYTREKVLLDTSGGKEMFYNYGNGPIFYVTKDVIWLTENAPLIGKIPANQNYVTCKGVDKDGLHWKEIRMDGFRFGYSYVPSSSLERFEKAVNAVRFRE